MDKIDNTQKDKYMMKHSGKVTFGIIVSRVLGYLRDMLVANVFGAGFYADAFYAAFRIPNLFRRLFGESSLNAAFIPVFSEYLETKQKNEVQELINAIMTILFITLGILTLAGILLSFPLMKIITWGFDREKLLLATKLLRIMFPFMWLICLSALGLSILNCLKVFFVPAASSGSLSIAEIIFILFFVNLLPKQSQIEGLSYSVLIGGFLQLLINFLLIRQKGYQTTVVFNKFFYFFRLPPVKKVILLFIPVIYGFSIDQINALVDTFFASFLKEGSITALYYSNRLMQLPLSLFGISVATVALPQMSKEFVNKNYDQIKNTIIYSLRNITYFLLPSILGLVFLGKKIVMVLFERGSFTNEASMLTYSCLFFYSLGLIFFSFAKILISSFYAMKKPSVPVRIATICMFINAFLNFVLMKYLQVAGLALATTISSFFSCLFLYKSLKKEIDGFKFNKENYVFFMKIIFSNVLLSLFIIFLDKRFFAYSRYIGLFVTIILSIIFYFLITRLIKVEETNIIISLVKRKLSSIFAK